MGWGTIGNVTTDHLDSAADDPSQARVELYNALIELQAVINGRNTAEGVAGLDASALVPNSILPNTLISSTGNDLTLDPASGKVNIEDVLNLNPKTTAELEALTPEAGDIAYVTDGDAGAPCIAVSLGEQDSNLNAIWYRISLGAQISET
jgi:hypothetical protein